MAVVFIGLCFDIGTITLPAFVVLFCVLLLLLFFVSLLFLVLCCSLFCHCLCYALCFNATLFHGSVDVLVMGFCKFLY